MHTRVQLYVNFYIHVYASQTQVMNENGFRI